MHKALYKSFFFTSKIIKIPKLSLKIMPFGLLAVQNGAHVRMPTEFFFLISVSLGCEHEDSNLT